LLYGRTILALNFHLWVILFRSFRDLNGFTFLKLTRKKPRYSFGRFCPFCFNCLFLIDNLITLLRYPPLLCIRLRDRNRYHPPISPPRIISHRCFHSGIPSNCCFLYGFDWFLASVNYSLEDGLENGGIFLGNCVAEIVTGFATFTNIILKLPRTINNITLYSIIALTHLLLLRHILINICRSRQINFSSFIYFWILSGRKRLWNLLTGTLLTRFNYNRRIVLNQRYRHHGTKSLSNIEERWMVNKWRRSKIKMLLICIIITVIHSWSLKWTFWNFWWAAHSFRTLVYLYCFFLIWSILFIIILVQNEFLLLLLKKLLIGQLLLFLRDISSRKILLQIFEILKICPITGLVLKLTVSKWILDKMRVVKQCKPFNSVEICDIFGLFY
jgi:hypothetical protein